MLLGLVVSIDLFCPFFMPFLYNWVTRQKERGIVCWRLLPLYEKGIKKTQNKPMETTWSDFDASNHQKTPFSFEKELLNPLFSLWKKAKTKAAKTWRYFLFLLHTPFCGGLLFSKGLFIFYYYFSFHPPRCKEGLLQPSQTQQSHLKNFQLNSMQG